MPLPEVLVEVATNLRTTNAVLQLLDASTLTAQQRDTVEEVKQMSRAVIEQLHALEDVGTVPPALQGAVFPTPGVMLGSTASLDADMEQLDVVTASDLDADGFARFQELRNRMNALRNSVAVAAVRRR